jgi:TP53 regulating kinase-like protein
MKILHSGAEAILYLENGNLVKERISKSYRHEHIDISKRKYPTRKENKLLLKANEVGMNVPEVFMFDDSDMKIVMEYLEGDVLKSELDNYSSEKRIEVCKKIGEQVALMHDNEIIHGDLTTSNMILKDNKVYFIDFGLGMVSDKDEPKAVDIRLLRQAFDSRHYKYNEEFYNWFLEGYKQSKNYDAVIKRLEQVEKRGRYKRKSA